MIIPPPPTPTPPPTQTPPPTSAPLRLYLDHCRQRKERKERKRLMNGPMARDSARGEANPTFAFLFPFSEASVKFGFLDWEESWPPSIFLKIQLLLLHLLKLFVAFVERRVHRPDDGTTSTWHRIPMASDIWTASPWEKLIPKRMTNLSAQGQWQDVIWIRVKGPISFTIYNVLLR